jgi:isoleucyl-tRNA synthetase
MGLRQIVLNEAKRLNVWNDWNGSLPTVNSEFSSQKIRLFSDLSTIAIGLKPNAWVKKETGVVL